MSTLRYLIDTSALVRVVRNPLVRKAWEPQITAGLVATCAVVELEILYTARSIRDRHEWLSLFRDAFGWVVMPDRVFDRAEQTQDLLTKRGLHRCAGAVDLLIAATAELEGLSLLHYDRDFEQVAAVTGQSAAWVIPAGAVP